MHKFYGQFSGGVVGGLNVLSRTDPKRELQRNDLCALIYGRGYLTKYPVK